MNFFGFHKQFIIALSLLLLTLSGFSQINFFTSDANDSLTTDFYKRNLKLTALVIGNIQSKDVGASFFIHNPDDRISYYFDFKTNLKSDYVISGTEINGNGIQQKIIPYRSFICNVGIARGFTRNWFIYGATGFVAKRSYFENSTTDTYSYNIPNHGMWYNLSLGAMYVSDNKISVQAGMDLYNKSINFGLGYTL